MLLFNQKKNLVKTIDELLIEVSEGNFEDFRKYLPQETHLDVGYGIPIPDFNFSNLSRALQGTNVIAVI